MQSIKYVTERRQVNLSKLNGVVLLENIEVCIRWPSRNVFTVMIVANNHNHRLSAF